jgi:hypothetical protein
MFKIKYRRYKEFSGPMIRGTIPFNLDKDHNHAKRILWLTTMVESGGKFGATMGYDGTGNTSGLIQCIAVYPRELSMEDNYCLNDQGTLWPLIEEVAETSPAILEELYSKLEHRNWTIRDGKVRVAYSEDNSKCVNGRILRNELTPNNGKVPRLGKKWNQAKEWALVFHKIFSHPESFDAQIRFGIKHFNKIIERKNRYIDKKSISDLIYGKGVEAQSLDLFDPIDLALCFFFSNSVNAPAIAFRKLGTTFASFKRVHRHEPNFDSSADRESFAKILIRVLGTYNFGRWHFENVNGRYQRTRKVAMKVWPSAFFVGKKAIMPKKF